MSTTYRNIVQAEFFHCLRDPESAEALKDLLRELVDRKSTGSSIKTSLRFYDGEEALVTKSVLSLERRREKRESLSNRLLDGSGVWPLITNFQHHYACRKMRRMEQRHLSLIRSTAASRVQSSPHEVAIECNDHSFRQLERDEVHELLESLQKVHGVWTFVFRPNELLADENILIASFMW